MAWSSYSGWQSNWHARQSLGRYQGTVIFSVKSLLIGTRYVCGSEKKTLRSSVERRMHEFVHFSSFSRPLDSRKFARFGLLTVQLLAQLLVRGHCSFRVHGGLPDPVRNRLLFKGPGLNARSRQSAAVYARSLAGPGLAPGRSRSVHLRRCSIHLHIGPCC